MKHKWTKYVRNIVENIGIKDKISNPYDSNNLILSLMELWYNMPRLSVIHNTIAV